MIRYWIKYSKDYGPTRCHANNWEDFLWRYLDSKVIAEKGEIEWIIKD